jgi:hypothetical protein
MTMRLALPQSTGGWREAGAYALAGSESPLDGDIHGVTGVAASARRIRRARTMICV